MKKTTVGMDPLSMMKKQATQTNPLAPTGTSPAVAQNAAASGLTQSQSHQSMRVSTVLDEIQSADQLHKAAQMRVQHQQLQQHKTTTGYTSAATLMGQMTPSAVNPLLLNNTSSSMTQSNNSFQRLDAAQIAANINNRRKEQLKLAGLDYEPEEQPMFRFEVRELNKAKDIGELYLSSFKLFFKPNSVRDPNHAKYFSVPYGYIHAYQATANEGKNQGTITIYCKDERCLKFKFETSLQQYRDTLKAIKQASHVYTHDLLYCHRAVAYLQASAATGTSVNLKLINHDDVARLVFQEFERLAISTNTQRFAFFEHSKPEKVLLPQVCYTSAVGSEIQRYCTYLRKSGRVPTVVYVHPAKGGGSRSAGQSGAIWRSSELKAELQQRVSEHDKQMFKMMINYTDVVSDDTPTPQTQSDPSQQPLNGVEAKPLGLQTSQRKKLFIFSSRSDSQTMNQYKSMGFSFESPSVYPNIVRCSYNMNYASLTKSFNEMWTLALNRHGVKKVEQNLMTKVVKTDWLAHVENILSQARRVAELVFNGESVLVYCPSGNVGTPLLTSLAQLYLDPFYRTFEGFKVLVLKEWVYYRYNFIKDSQVLASPEDRKESQKQNDTPSAGMFGYGNLFATQTPKQNIEKKIRPCFILFLDAVSQLIKQNPLAFEINARYTARLASLIYTNRYFEFVQSDDFVSLDIVAKTAEDQSTTITTAQEESKNPQQKVAKKNETSKLLSAFDQLKDRTKYANKAYNSDKFRQMQPKELSHGRKGKLTFEPRNMVYWEEYFSQYENERPELANSTTSFSKADKLHEVRSNNYHIVEQVIQNITQVEKMRIGPNELVFSGQFLLEHKQIIGRLSSVTGIAVEKINSMVRKRIQSENRGLNKPQMMVGQQNINNADAVPRYVQSSAL